MLGKPKKWLESGDKGLKISNPIILGLVVLFIGCIYLAVWLSEYNRNIFEIVGGLFLVLFGGLVLKYGDKKINVDEGDVGRLFFPQRRSEFYSKLWKWVIGVLSIWEGLWLLFNKL